MSASKPKVLFPAYLNEALVREALESGLEYPARTSVNIDQFIVRTATSAGDNYLSDVFRVWVRFSRKSGLDRLEDEISLIVKCMPDTGFRGPVIGMLNAYEKEVYMVRNVVPELSRLMNGEKFAAKIFYATTDPIRMIIFQDLKVLEFTMADRTLGGLDYSHCSTIMRKIAKFHAASMLLANSNKPMAAELTKRLEYGFLNPHIPLEDNTMLDILANGLTSLVTCAEKHWTGFNPKIVAKLKRMMPHYKARIQSCLNQKFSNGYKVVNHGDLWINNILFQYDANGSPKDVMFVDYQLSCYTSPGIDLNYSLVNCPTYEVRENRRDELVNVYHTTLKAILKAADYRDVPTLEDVRNEIRRMSFFGVIAAVSILPIVMMDTSSGVDISFDALVDEHKADQLRLLQYNGERYRKSMSVLLERFDREGLLD
ncbi:uncharacterized protein LOC5576476 [Aedes aegypti]|uniref:CHK kinase-like domain-containing protein n=1 Tax=Aedes aegypti TaxID=7159 RepID=A0A1S4F392_AEDAE|nr:uncharacterized protein LOC5576476 [Aedes aegypti]